MLARTMSSSLFGTTSDRQSHSSKVQGDRKSTFSAAVTKRRAARAGMTGFMIRIGPEALSSSSPLGGERIEVRGVGPVSAPYTDRGEPVSFRRGATIESSRGLQPRVDDQTGRRRGATHDGLAKA